MKTMMRKARQSRKAQSIVEFALGSFLLLMLLAASVDLGRAFYTWIVVQNMAGEGAGYAGGILSAGVDGIKVAEAVALSMVGADDAKGGMTALGY